MDSGSAAGESDAKKDNSEQDDGDATRSKLLCRWLPPMYREELYHTMKLTGPMAISRLLEISIKFVTSVFCGHIGSAQLGGFTLAFAAINVTTVSMGFGLVRACDTFISQTFGGQNMKRVGVIVQRSSLILFLFCFLCWAVLLNFSNIMLLLHQDEKLVRIANVYVVAYLPAIPAVLLRELQSSYLQNQGITLPQMFCSMATNVFNVISNYVLIYSLQLGGTGSSITNSLSDIVSCLLLFGFIRWKKLHVETWDGWSMECLQEWGAYMKLAVPCALVMCFDWWIFEIVSVLAGVFGEAVLAAQHVLYQITLVKSMVSIAISAAACVRVGNALGAGDTERAVVSGKVALLSAGTVAVVQGIIIAVIKPYVGYIFTSDQNIVATVSQILTLNIFAAFFEELLLVSTGICLGSGLQAIVAFANMICYYVIGLAVGTPLMFVAQMSLFGLLAGVWTGILLESLFFLGLFYKIDWKKITKKAQKRAGVPAEGAPVSVAQGDGVVPDSDCQNTADCDSVGVPKAEGYTLVSTQELKVYQEDEGNNADAGPPDGDAEQSNTGSRPNAPLSVPQLLLRRGLAVLVVVLILVLGVALHVAFPVPEPTILLLANGTMSENKTLPLHH
ncbi:multidrug and toxin extrusion protein 1-like isoform X1 [Takifugu flavidus]|nr:multidrug and toxin extrusion protein 1-like isoform X1 [Takifugu flavidus]XP_056910620.1 multidrug and toxin extrusion protein 1-like isoform X1 [Takifugu flavidus]XP_056910621.1 multidrug and toxin extrusion protein 1-like isoform X1 [Takifugu flavidus]XP_056910622.1 multidrug and toxin extrusion protein 1-like isoform X1 [Takifugu flavidus]XP_056910623.1 multidrug and toxin extrusion protein 1-like isoform X1 [Takifugu flavidus]XP_056910624.1 multidrug and toxin extrusion protein 1-like 